MVHAVVSCPMPDASLIGDRVCQHQVDTQGEGGLVRSVRPQPVHTTGDSDSGDWPQKERPKKGVRVARRDFEQTNNRSDVG